MIRIEPKNGYSKNIVIEFKTEEALIVFPMKIISTIIAVLSTEFAVNLLDLIQRFAIIIASLSFILTVINYFYRRKQDKIQAVIDQVSFFRKEIFIENERLVNSIRNKEKEYSFSRIRLDNPDIESIKEKFPEEVKKQYNLLKDYKTLPEQTAILNMLEEFSLRVVYSNTEKHEAMKSIKSAFIELVEVHALVLLTHREIISGNELFSATLKLYSFWKDEVDRTPAKERIQKLLKK